MMRVLMPIPDRDFDPTETSVPWTVLTEAGVEVVFATPSGEPGEADPRMVTGAGLGIWRWVLPAKRDAVEAYEAMRSSPAFQKPLSYDELDDAVVDGLVLPGGHAQGMKPFLESAEVQRLVVRTMRASAPVGAICHGVLAAARSIDPETGRSVLHGRKTTALLKSLELTGWWMTRLWLGDYYRTYPETVQAEVVGLLESAEDFVEGPLALSRDTRAKPGFSVRDGNYVSARWPGDAWGFSNAFLEVLRSA